MPSAMSSCTHLLGARIALPLPALCVHTAENSPWNLSLCPNHQTRCLLNPPNLRHSLGKEEAGETLARRAADSVCISPSVCRAWPGRSLQVLWIYHSSGSMFCAPGEPNSCSSDLRKVPWTRHTLTCLWDGTSSRQRWRKLSFAVSQRKLLEGEELPSGLPRESFLIHNAWK